MEHEMVFGGVAKIPVVNTFNELVEMDFSDYGDFPRSCAFRKLFRARLSFLRGGEGQSAGMVRGGVPNWVAAFGAPGIIVAGNDSIF